MHKKDKGGCQLAQQETPNIFKDNSNKSITYGKVLRTLIINKKFMTINTVFDMFVKHIANYLKKEL